MKFESRKINIHKKIGGWWCVIWYNGFLYDADNLYAKRNRVNDFSGGHLYMLYRWYEFYLYVIFYEDLVEIDKLTEVTSIEYLITL